MRDTYRWYSRYALDNVNTMIGLTQELYAEVEELTMECACLQEEAWHNDTLWKKANQFIQEKGLSDEYQKWVGKK